MKLKSKARLKLVDLNISYNMTNNNKLFNDYKKKQDILNQLQQKYSYKEGLEYTFFPIINNYIIKYQNPCFINSSYFDKFSLTNKHAITEYENNISKNKSKSKNQNKKYNEFTMVKQREKTIKNNDNKNKKRKLELNMPYNYVNYFRDKSFNKSFDIRTKTDNRSIMNKSKEKETTLKSIINEEKNKANKTKILNKINANKLINRMFNNNNKNINKDMNQNRIKTESSFLFSNDESNILIDKTYNNNFRVQSECNNSTSDDISFLMKKINSKINIQKNNNNSNYINNAFNNNKKLGRNLNNHLFNKKIDYSNDKIISIDLKKL